MSISVPNQRIASGDLDGDGVDDLIGVWNDGVWAKYSSTNIWRRISPVARDVSVGDMNGDGREDFLGTWDENGVFYLDSKNGIWIKMSTSANLVTSGDLDSDAIDDLIGIWSDGVWVKYSRTGKWKKITGILPKNIDSGTIREGVLSTTLGDYKELIKSVSLGDYIKRNRNFRQYSDLSQEGPLGWGFVFQIQKNQYPKANFPDNLNRTPGPGEPGFTYYEQDNIVPQLKYKKKNIN
jgi:hypothetical protein